MRGEVRVRVVVLVVLGVAATAAGSDLLAADDDLTLLGYEQAGLGTSALFADVNGDGFQDLVVGADAANVGGVAGAGAVMIVFGPMSRSRHGEPTVDVNRDADVRIRGVDEWQGVGILLGSGDLNGDGEVDLVLSAKNGPGFNGGEVYVFFGPIDHDASTDDADVRIYGLTDGDRVGLSLAVADFDGDGRDDLVVGAPGDDARYDDGGAVYVFWGDPVTFPSGPTVVSEADVALHGDEGQQAGWDVAAIDLGGPVPGLAIGAPLAGAGRTGAVYVVNDLSVPAGADLVDEADSVIAGGARGDYFGFHVDAVGDVDGDGVDDLVVNARDAQTSYLFAGATLVTPGAIGEAADASAVFVSDATSGIVVPLSVAGGRITRDVHRDLVFSDYIAHSAEGPRRGAVYLFEGPVVPGAYGLAADADLTLGGGGSSDFFGYVVTVGDANDDGIDDLLVTEQLDASKRGSAHLFFAPFDELSGEVALGGADAAVIGDAAAAALGFTVAGVGDVDCDGIDDVAIGAPLAGGDGGGAVYVFLGPRDGSALRWQGGGFVGADADVVFRGARGDLAGVSVTGARVLGTTGSGRACTDLVVGAPGSRGGGGAAYVVAIGPEPPAVLGPGDADRVVRGQPGERLGVAVASLGDLDGDGLDELGAGAPLADLPTAAGVRLDTGAVVVVPGGRWSAVTCRLSGEQAGEHLGASLAALDLDEDGARDVVAGGPGWDQSNAIDVGNVRVFSAVRCAGPQPRRFADRRLVGTHPHGKLGHAVAGAGSTLVAGAPDVTEPGGRVISGRAYLVADGFGTVARIDDVAVTVCGTGHARLGASLAASPGRDGWDVVIGQPLVSAGGIRRAGGALVFRAPTLATGTVGAGCLRPTDADLVLHGAGAGGRTGAAVAFAGDPNLDGEPDLIVGAPWHGALAPFAGGAWVVLSSAVPD